MEMTKETPEAPKIARAKLLASGGGVTTREIDLAPFGTNRRKRLLKLAVVRYLANERQGTHKTKTRSETSYSEAKPWPQKHTGRARAGDKNSPLWRHGGTIFGPQPRDYRLGMPTRARREALRSALLGKLLDGEVAFVEALQLDKPSTKQAAKALQELGTTSGATVVVNEPGDALYRSFRNIADVDVVAASDVNALHVLRRKCVVFIGDAFAAVAKRLALSAAGKPAASA